MKKLKRTTLALTIIISTFGVGSTELYISEDEDIKLNIHIETPDEQKKDKTLIELLFCKDFPRCQDNEDE